MVCLPSAGLPVELYVYVSLLRKRCCKRPATDSSSYFVIGNLAESDEEVIRYAGLLRGTESAVQAVSVRAHIPTLHRGK